MHYDDCAARIETTVGKHNRVVLVLQGLLDRSPVFAPHPPWVLGTHGGFMSALELVYDDARTLVVGDKPDFEAYRARLNAKFKVGDIAVGQELAWEEHEADKYNHYKETHSWKFSERDRYSTVERHRPYGNPGPGKLARAVRATKTACSFEWQKENTRARYQTPSVACKLVAHKSKLLNVSAYTPGDFKQFFADPRTRAEYLKWAPLLLLAEEYHAGNRKVGNADETNDS